MDLPVEHGDFPIVMLVYQRVPFFPIATGRGPSYKLADTHIEFYQSCKPTSLSLGGPFLRDEINSPDFVIFFHHDPVAIPSYAGRTWGTNASSPWFWGHTDMWGQAVGGVAWKLGLSKFANFQGGEKDDKPLGFRGNSWQTYSLTLKLSPKVLNLTYL